MRPRLTLCLLPLVVLAVLARPSAALAESGCATITGQTFDLFSGRPYTTVKVVAYRWDEASRRWLNTGLYAWPDGHAVYTLTSRDGVPLTGRIKLGFDATTLGGEWAYYKDASSLLKARELVVAEGQTIAGIDQAVPVWGRVTGRVTDRATGLPIKGVSVQLKRWSTELGAWDVEYPAVETVDDGTYWLPGPGIRLRAGSYRVECIDNLHRYQSLYYGGARTVETASDVSVPRRKAHAKPADIVLAVRPLLVGRVLGADGEPLPGATVIGFILRPNGTYSWTDETVTDENGDYTIACEAPGDYILYLRHDCWTFTDDVSTYLGGRYETDAIRIPVPDSGTAVAPTWVLPVPSAPSGAVAAARRGVGTARKATGAK